MEGRAHFGHAGAGTCFRAARNSLLPDQFQGWVCLRFSAAFLPIGIAGS